MADFLDLVVQLKQALPISAARPASFSLQRVFASSPVETFCASIGRRLPSIQDQLRSLRLPPAKAGGLPRIRHTLFQNEMSRNRFPVPSLFLCHPLATP